MNSLRNNPLIVTDLTKSFQETQLRVFENISLTVGKGELVSIIGPSGCGKSTLLDCIAGLTPIESGTIQKNERPAYMFQDDVLFPWQSILDNVIMPLELAGIKKSKAQKEAKKLLTLFGLEKFASYYPFMLSGGMLERASLLRTYLTKKDLMLLDEPFSKLDALTRQTMQQWFLSILKKQKKSVLFVTHDVDEAILLSDRIYVLSSRPATIKAEISVTLKKPRTLETVLTPEFIALKKKIMAILLHDKK